MTADAMRILDANFNRCAEGLRVVEDYLRLSLNDRHLAEACKEARHRLSEVRGPLADRLLAARDTLRDVGTEIQTEQEQRRSDSRHVAAASQARVEQSLRCLEEYLKLVDARAAEQIEALRYHLYALSAAWQRTSHSVQRLSGCLLYVLMDGGDTLESMSTLAEQLTGDGGADALQLRDKRLDDRTLLHRARRLREITRFANRLLIINDRPDLAALCDADGVHVGQDELPAADARRIVGVDRLVGVSTHSLEQARRAVLDGADYIGCGPVFPSHTKQFDEHVGPELLRQVSSEIRLPAFAIGGVAAANISKVREAGFTRVAVGHAVCGAASPANEARRLRLALAMAN